MAIGAIIALTNVFVEVLKQFIPDEKFSTNLLALIVSVILSVIGTYVYCSANGIAVTWIVWVAAVIIGFLCAYGSMVGYDKVIKLFEDWFKKN